MATGNPFDLLIDNENDDLSQLIASQQKKLAAAKPAGVAVAPAAAKLPSKPVPPAQAVRESRNSNTANARESARGGVSGRGRGGRGVGIGQSRDFGSVNNSRFSRAVPEEGDGVRTFERERGSSDHARGSFRGGRRGGFADGNGGGGLDSDRRRAYERKSGTGRGVEMKREGAGRGNWGTATDDADDRVIDENRNFEEMPVVTEKQVSQDDGQRGDASKDKEEAVTETEEKEPEDNVCSFMPFILFKDLYAY